MADIWVGVNGADEALRQVNAEMLGGARALADQAGAAVVAIVWGASAAGNAKALASWGADRVVIVESEAALAPEAVARTLARLAAYSCLKRTSRLAGCTLTSTSSGDMTRNRIAGGKRPLSASVA